LYVFLAVVLRYQLFVATIIHLDVVFMTFKCRRYTVEFSMLVAVGWAS